MSIHSSEELAFAGLKVLDVSQGLAGPYCAQLLAQHGADVIKLEPAEGDWSRGIGTRHGSHSAIDLMANQGKKSLILDMKQPESVKAILRIAAQCDVMIEGFRPGVSAKLGMSYEQIKAVRPDIVYLSISGFGQTGPRAQQPATDTVIQAFSGMMSLNAGTDAIPRKLGFLAVDTTTALYAYQALSTALYRRQRYGKGCYLDISLMQATAAFLAPKIIETFFEGESPAAINVPAGVYQTQDGWIAITLSKESHYAALCQATGLEALATDPRFTSFVKRAPHAEYLQNEIAGVVRQQTTKAWLARFATFEVLASTAHTLTQWLDDPQVVAAQTARKFDDPEAGTVLLPAIPGAPALQAGDRRAHWPRIGEHSNEILHSLGFSEQEIQLLTHPSHK